MAKEVRGGKRSPEEISAEAALTLQEIMTCASPIRPKKIGDIAGEVLRHASAAKSGEALHGLNTGIAALDAILGLMLGGDLGAIIASQGDGKTVLATQIGAHAAEAGRPVLFEQLEMSDEQMGARELAAASGIPVNHIHEGAFDAFQWEQIVEAERHLRTLPFHIIDTEETTVRQIESQALTMQRMGGLSLVIIDQLDKIKAVGKYRDRFERMAEITRDLKKMAKRLKVPVLVLAQRTRGAQRRDDATPHVLDADAPSLERDCDWILGLWQVSNWMRQNKPDSRKVSDYEDWNTKIRQLEGKAEIIILKRRRGRAFQQCELRFEGARMRFAEAT
ncbi:MAG TPA: DnaB-like helicase C-terminal domain-containing protein [Xanthobacteraceae bacterium]|nr:DnaB-like helicase C-terminal domain-containing protein [Xanthobacteraceae bacterium]